MRSLSVIAVGLGIALLGISVIWGLLFPATRSWTEEKSQRMSEVGIEADQLGRQFEVARARPSMHGGRSAADLEAEYEKKTAELDELRLEFEGKRDSPKTTATIFRWTGVICVAIGAVAMMAARN